MTIVGGLFCGTKPSVQGDNFFFEELLLLTLQEVTDVSIGASNFAGVR